MYHPVEESRSTGQKTEKQTHPMRKVRVTLFFGRSFDRNDTAPVCASSAISGIRCVKKSSTTHKQTPQGDCHRIRIATYHHLHRPIYMATLALSIDTPIEVISQALGHSYGQAVTLGYIMPDRRKVDEANKKVLGLFL